MRIILMDGCLGCKHQRTFSVQRNDGFDAGRYNFESARYYRLMDPRFLFLDAELRSDLGSAKALQSPSDPRTKRTNDRDVSGGL